MEFLIPSHRFLTESDILVVIDAQDPFLNGLESGDFALKRMEFIVKSAKILGVPVIATEQVPSKLGSLFHSLAKEIGEDFIFPKTTFSSYQEPTFRGTLESSDRKNVIIVGAETHICVTSTALELAAARYQVCVCPDALAARTMERHKLGMERLRDSGVLPTHTESIVYEWLGSSNHPKFKEILAIVKNYV